MGAGYYVSSSETRELILKSASEAWFPANFFPPLVKLNAAVIIIDI